MLAILSNEAVPMTRQQGIITAILGFALLCLVGAVGLHLLTYWWGWIRAYPLARAAGHCGADFSAGAAVCGGGHGGAGRRRFFAHRAGHAAALAPDHPSAPADPGVSTVRFPSVNEK